MKIGLRIPGEGRKLPFNDFCDWASQAGFQAVDVGAVSPEDVQIAQDAGLEIGTADLPGTRDLCNPDPEKQEAGARAARAAIDAAAANGIDKMFCVFVPEEMTAGRRKNYEIWRETVPPVVEYAWSKRVRIAMEGWPGPPPHYAALGCTPEMWRVMFSDCSSPAFGLNFDPSHLVRIGVDWFRALDEFAPRIIHVHGKDTEIDQERLYEHGNLGPSLRAARPYGEGWWRYTIPGDGLVDWGKLVARLEDAGYDGIISVELEDHRYHEGWPKQAEGLRRSQQHLAKFVRAPVRQEYKVQPYGRGR